VQNNSTWAPSPPSPATWPPESFRVGRTLLAAVGAVLVVIAVLIAYVFVATSLGVIDPRRPESLGPSQILITQLVAYVPLAVYLLAVVPQVAAMSLAQLGVRPPTRNDLWIAVLGAVAMWLVVNVAAFAVEAITHQHDTEAAIQLLKSVRSPLEKLSFVAVAVLFAPLVEELAFRVFLFNAFRRWTNISVAAILSGVLFGLIHASSRAQLLTVAVPLSLGAIVLALVYARTRCYWSSVVTHALFNSVTVIAFFVFHVKS
jgi:membrane protease YdiL (CAAX protease family)